ELIFGLMVVALLSMGANASARPISAVRRKRARWRAKFICSLDFCVRVSANDLALARALSSRLMARSSWASSAPDYPCAGGARGRLGDPSASHAGAIAFVKTTYCDCVSKL